MGGGNNKFGRRDPIIGSRVAPAGIVVSRVIDSHVQRTATWLIYLDESSSGSVMLFADAIEILVILCLSILFDGFTPLTNQFLLVSLQVMETIKLGNVVSLGGGEGVGVFGGVFAALGLGVALGDDSVEKRSRLRCNSLFLLRRQVRIAPIWSRRHLSVCRRSSGRGIYDTKKTRPRQQGGAKNISGSYPGAFTAKSGNTGYTLLRRPLSWPLTDCNKGSDKDSHLTWAGG